MESSQEKEQEWQITFDAIRDPVMILDAEFRIVRVNAATVSYLKLPQESILGNPCYALMHGTSRPLPGCPFEKAIRTRGYEEAEVCDEQNDRWLRVSAHPMFDESGRVTNIVHVIRDITEHKNAEQQLKDSEQRLRLAVQAARMFAFEWDPRTDRDMSAVACTDILGIDAESGARGSYLTRIHPDDRANLFRSIEELSPASPDYRASYRLARADGQTLWLEESAHGFFDRDDKLVKLIGIAADVTERVNAEEETRQLREHMARMSRISAMGELTATLAHELSQSLGAITLSVQACQRMLKRPAPDLEELRATLAAMIADSRRANEVVGRARDFLRRGEAPKSQIDLNEIVRSVVPMVNARLVRDQIKLTLDLDPDIPPITGGTGPLQQVIFNLIINAADAVVPRPVSSREVKVDSRMLPDGMASVAVADSGIGVPAQDLDRLFDLFFTTKPDGTGMGLPICKSIIEAHGGRLSAESDGCRGSVFRFTIPTDGGPPP